MAISRRVSGFTLIELLVTVAVAILLVAVAFPNMRSMVLRSAQTAGMNDLIASMQLARAEANKRGEQVTLCASANPLDNDAVCAADGWEQGWIVFVDFNQNGAREPVDFVLERHGSLRSSLTIETADAPALAAGITYATDGFIVNPPAAEQVFVFCDTRGDDSARGRGRVHVE